MTTHTSATAQEETPHETETTVIRVSDATKRRAQSVINDRTIDPEWRTIIRGALDLNDPWLAESPVQRDQGSRRLEHATVIQLLRHPSKITDRKAF